MTTLTFQYQASTTRGGYRRLELAMLDMGLLAGWSTKPSGGADRKDAGAQKRPSKGVAS